MTDRAPEDAASRGSDCPPCPGRPVLERITARPTEIGGGLTVRRALPHARRRMVGAWCFLDHAGPVQFAAGGGLGVGPHPHIGLQTFTWMIEGAVMHRDSLGNEQVITPGQVNLMTAGRGIAHAEDSLPTATALHAAQLWIALPGRERHRAPAFRNYPQLPRHESGGFTVRVLAGSCFGSSSPVEVYSPLLGLDLTASGAASLDVPLAASFEHALLVLRGAVRIESEALGTGTLLYLGTQRQRITVSCDAAAQLLIVGGEPFAEDILLWWNFVARTPEEMEQARRDWNGGTRFGTVHGSPSAPLVAPDSGAVHLRAARPS
jgi:quercetin 2,3-dioxygenase